MVAGPGFSSVDGSAAEVVPVLIVGGGPAGLTAALELARRGVEGLRVGAGREAALFTAAGARGDANG